MNASTDGLVVADGHCYHLCWYVMYQTVVEAAVKYID